MAVSKRPKLRSDEAKLKELFICCRMGNYREVKALVFHYPYLLSMTDSYGFTALHHAEMSGNADFMAKLLELYQDPRAFARKFVRYHSEEDLCLDGFQLQRRSSIFSQKLSATGSASPRQSSKASPTTEHNSRHSSKASPRTDSERTIVVRLVASSSAAAAAGVVPGDMLVAVEGSNTTHNIELSPEDICDVMLDGVHLEEGYPLVLEFHGPASAEILGRDSWTPLHAAAGGGAHYKKVCHLLRREQEKLPTAARDGHGCTPEHWNLISKRGVAGPKRRPLSAGPCPQRRPSLAMRERTTADENVSTRNFSNARAKRQLPPRAPLPPAPPPPPMPQCI